VLKEYVKLTRIDTPELPKKSVAPSIIFTTPEYATKNTLVFMIPGSGVVRASQWARSICINDSLVDGTCIPFVNSARKRGWGVILCDPNARLMKTAKDKGRVFPIQHCKYIFKNYVVDLLKKDECAIKNIFIVAHSAGGWCTTELLELYSPWLEEHNLIKGIAFTDCGDPGQWVAKPTMRLFRKYGRNWVGSGKPLDTAINSDGCNVKRVSAGNPQHEWTSASAYQSILKFFDHNLGLKYKYETAPSNETVVSENVTTESEKKKNRRKRRR